MPPDFSKLSGSDTDDEEVTKIPDEVKNIFPETHDDMQKLEFALPGKAKRFQMKMQEFSTLPNSGKKPDV